MLSNILGPHKASTIGVPIREIINRMTSYIQDFLNLYL